MKMNNQPCVFIVDDDDAVRDGLALVIETVGLNCQTFSNAEHFLNVYVPGTPGCLVLDINMPGMKGDDLQTELNRRRIHLPIIFLTAYGDIPMSVRTIKAGAVDFMTKPVKINLLIERIQAELQLEAEKQEQNKDILDLHKRLSTLTHREMDILPLTVAGMPNKEIAQKLGISFRTVELHRTNILRKTGASNFLELARQCEAIQFSFEPKNEN
jgi:FixJ family two-component response regulator